MSGCKDGNATKCALALCGVYLGKYQSWFGSEVEAVGMFFNRCLKGYPYLEACFEGEAPLASGRRRPFPHLCDQAPAFAEQAAEIPQIQGLLQLGLSLYGICGATKSQKPL